MQLECSNCQKSLNLPDAKLPVGKPFSFTCPYCRQKNSAFIPADGGQQPAPAAAPPMPMEGAAMTALPGSDPPRPAGLTPPPT